jgi:hypothetical protein
VTQEVAQILETKGYKLTCRGTIRVKGKGDMVTYFLEERPENANNVQGPILRNSIAAVKTVTFSSSNFGRISAQKGTDINLSEYYRK